MEMEHHRTLKITLQYANGLHKVNLISKMDVYALVSISDGDKSLTQITKTPSDPAGDCNPSWGFPMKFTVEEAALQQNRIFLDFKLVCKRALGDKDVGEAYVAIKELVDSSLAKGRAGGKKFVSYQVRKPSGRPKGHITFSYQFVGEGATTTGETLVPTVHGGAVAPSSIHAKVAPTWFYPVMLMATEKGRGYDVPQLDNSAAGDQALRGCGCENHSLIVAVTAPSNPTAREACHTPPTSSTAN